MLSIFLMLSFLSSSYTNIHATAQKVFTVNPKNIPSPIRKNEYAWHEFEKFRDASKGRLVMKGISKVKKYLHRFGYLEDMNTSDIFDSNLEVAIKKYQQKMDLPASGKLDFGTLSQLMIPRCGVSDYHPPTLRKDSNKKRKANQSDALHPTNNYVYFSGRPRWARNIPMRLTYAFSPKNMTSCLSMADVRNAFKRSFARWASVIPITFTESHDYSFADIKIAFYSGDHEDGEPFDGVLGVLGHAFSPESGRLHLDAAETWAVDLEAEKSGVAVDLESVATHEIGHVLGLGHSEVKEAVMYPSLRAREKKMELKMDDIRGVQALYGSNPNFSFQDSFESYISSDGDGDGDGGFRVQVVGLILVLYMLILGHS